MPAAALVLAAMAAWGGWIISKARTPADYAALRADPSRPVPACTWLRPGDEGVGSLGLSLSADLSWTDRTEAYVVLPTAAMPRGGDVDLDIAAIAAQAVDIDVEGSAQRLRLSTGRQVRIPIEPRPAGTLRIQFDAHDPKPPSDGDRRWLGAALVRLRVCPR